MAERRNSDFSTNVKEFHSTFTSMKIFSIYSRGSRLRLVDGVKKDVVDVGVVQADRLYLDCATTAIRDALAGCHPQFY